METREKPNLAKILMAGFGLLIMIFLLIDLLLFYGMTRMNGQALETSTSLRVLLIFSVLTGTGASILLAMITAQYIKHSTRSLKEKQTELFEKQAMFHAAMDHGHGGIVIVDAPDGRIRYINQEAKNFLGAPEKSIHETSMQAYFSDWKITRVDGTPFEENEVPLTRALRFGETSGMDFMVQTHEGEFRRISANSAPINDANGETIAAISIFLDIAKLRKTEESLKKSEMLLNEIQRISGIGGWEYRVKSNQVIWTDEAYRIHGVAKGEFDPNDPSYWEVFFHPEDGRNHREKFQRAIKNGESYEAEYQLRRGNGDLWVKTTVQVEKKGEEIIRVFGNMMDIDESKKAELKQKSLEEQLTQAQKMEAVGRLAGGVSHDFNNLLSVTLGYSEMILDEIQPDHPFHERLKAIHEVSIRAKNLTRQLLAFGRKQILEVKPIPINEVITGFEKLLRRVIGEDIRLHIRCARDIGLVRADISQMEQVLMNLVVNARDAMPDGGELTLETASVYLDSTYLESNPGLNAGRYVLLSISDTGTGMPPELLSLIFEPFFSTKSKDKGTGLGLSTVYGIVKQHGGDISVFSEIGHGTTFKIFLPNIQDTSLDEPELLSQKGPGIGSGTILLVEDEPSVRKLTFNILTGNGYSVMAAASAEDAILQAKAFKEPIDLLLTDVILPGMKGPELKEEISKIHPETLVLFMSGYSGEMISRQGILKPGIQFMHKPFSKKDLLQKVADVISESDKT